MLPMQAGDIPVTCADIQDVFTDVGFKPSTSIEMGMENLLTGTSLIIRLNSAADSATMLEKIKLF